jgi:hypothetical protein
MAADSYAILLASISEMEVVDTHDHLRFVGDLPAPINLTDLLHHTYVAKSLRPADGSPNGLSGPPVATASETYEGIREIVRKAGFSSYFHWLLRGLVELYGLPSVELGPEQYERLAEEIPVRYRDPGWLPGVLDRARIRSVIWDPFWRPGITSGPDARLIPSIRINSSVVAFHPTASDYEGCNVIRDWGEAFDISVQTLTDLEDLIDRLVRTNVDAGARSLKSALAYDRPLLVGSTSRNAAAAVFGKSPDQITEDQKLTFGDYVIGLYMELARAHSLVVQVHTGLARLGDSSPLQMLPLIEAYPDLTFDLFHGGYPWIHDVAAIAQNYPNVALNLAWLPQISPEAAVAALKEWIQVVPQADRITWGADCHVVEDMYGSLLAARHVIARALAELVEDGYLSVDDALAEAASILFRAGEAIYRLPHAKAVARENGSA